MQVNTICVATLTLATTLHASVVLADEGAENKQLETIVVTASPITQDRSFLATIVDSVSRAEILKSGGANLADALANEPGVTGTGSRRTRSPCP